MWQDAALLRVMLEGAALAVVVVDQRGAILAWNASAEAMFGHRAEDIVGQPVTVLMPERSRAAHRAALRGAVRSEGTGLVGSTVELTALTADGRELPIELQLGEHRAGGRVVFTAMIRDISERARIERDLEEKQAQLVQAERLGCYGHYVFDVPADRWTSSPGLDEVFGIDATHPRTTEGWLQVVHPDDRADMAAYFRDEVLGAGRRFERRYRIVDQRTGHTKWVHGVGRLSHGVDGEPAQLIGTIQDVTERVQYERQLERLAEERSVRLRELRCLHGLTEQLHSALDLDEILQTTADLVPSGWGTPEEVVVRIRYADREVTSGPPDGSETWLESELEVRDKRGVVEVRRRADADPGSVVADDEAGAFVEAIANLLAGRIEQHLARAEQAELRAQYHEAQKMEAIGTLAGGIAHDFNNVLAAITGHAEIARDELPAELGTARESIEEVLSASRRASDLVGHILTVSRREAQDRRPVALNRLLREAAKMIRAMIPTTIRVDTDIDGQPLVVNTDPTRIHQIVLNLATNAAHAMEGGGGNLRIALEAVRARERGSDAGAAVTHARLTVSDTGRGIDPAVASRIFEPYFTTKPLGRGTGLGLAVVQSIVASHDGHIRVDSRPGKGTTITVDLPTVEGDHRHASIPVRTEARPTGTERVLFVDDEPSIVRAMRRLLGRLGYGVTTAGTAAEALAAFRAAPDDFDVVLTDLTMPGMSGRELAAAVRELRPDVPVILCSGTIDRNAPPELSATVDAFVHKPFSLDEVARVLRGVLDGARDGGERADRAAAPVSL